MKITALLENTAKRDDMLTEHGLSLYIETERMNILFDMGQSDMFYQNAMTLGIDIGCADIAVLSHGHYDHGGGLEKFLKVNSHAPIYISRDAFLAHYNGTEKYIGLDTSLKDSGRIAFTDGDIMLANGILLTHAKEMKSDTSNSKALLEKCGDTFKSDDFRHEQYLLIEEHGKRVLFSGCSHRGIIKIAEYFSPDVIIGGFHYSKLPVGEELDRAAAALECMDTVFYTCHCTGTEQYAYMKERMKELRYLSCGQSIVI